MGVSHGLFRRGGHRTSRRCWSVSACPASVGNAGARDCATGLLVAAKTPEVWPSSLVRFTQGMDGNGGWIIIKYWLNHETSVPTFSNYNGDIRYIYIYNIYIYNSCMIQCWFMEVSYSQATPWILWRWRSGFLGYHIFRQTHVACFGSLSFEVSSWAMNGTYPLPWLCRVKL